MALFTSLPNWDAVLIIWDLLLLDGILCLVFTRNYNTIHDLFFLPFARLDNNMRDSGKARNRVLRCDVTLS